MQLVFKFIEMKREKNRKLLICQWSKLPLSVCIFFSWFWLPAVTFLQERSVDAQYVYWWRDDMIHADFAKKSIPLPNIFGNVITYFLEVLIIVVYSICCLSRCNMKSKLQQQFINDDEIYKTKWRALNLKKKWKEIFVKNAKK